jgi:ATP-grasp domain, R2K clade family 3
MNFSKVVLFKEGELEIEEQLIFENSTSLNLPIEFASMKQMERNKVEISDSCLIVGPVGFIKHALRRLGKSIPEHNPYPECLQKFLHRQVRFENSLKNVLSEIESGKSLFIKPARGWKRFTGFVCDNPFDYRFKNASKNAPVWVSEPVVFVSEWRVYIADWCLVGICPSPTNEKFAEKPDPDVIDDAIDILYENKLNMSSFAIDFGVLSTGETSLVEMNDGFACGAYRGINSANYFEMIANRWKEIVYG